MTLLNFNFTKSQFDFSGRFSIYSLYAKNLQKTTYGLVNFNVCGVAAFEEEWSLLNKSLCRDTDIDFL